VTAREVWGLFSRAARYAKRDHTAFIAAGLSFFLIFSLVPVALIGVTIAGAVWGDALASGELLGGVSRLLGDEPARFLASVLSSAQRPGAAGVVSLFAVLFGASALFYHLQNALNLMWGLGRRRGVRGAVTGRLLAFGMVLVVGILMMVFFGIHAAISVARGEVGDLLPELGRLRFWKFLNGLVAFTSLSFLIAAVYKALPSVKLRWKDVWVGGVVTSLLLSLSNSIIGFYFSKAHYTTFYGAGATVLVLLLWVYFSAQVFLFGAEFTWAYARTFGSWAGGLKEDDDGQESEWNDGSEAPRARGAARRPD
jgi:membrane protein